MIDHARTLRALLGSGWGHIFSNSAKPTNSTDSVYGQSNFFHYTSLGSGCVALRSYGTGVHYFGSTASGNVLRLKVDGVVNYDITPTANNPVLAYSQLTAAQSM